MRGLILALGLGLCASGPVMGGAQELADDLAGSVGASKAISFPVISDWVMWRVRVAGGDVTVTLNDKARVDAAMAVRAGQRGCAVLGRSFAASPQGGTGPWTFKEACR